MVNRKNKIPETAISFYIYDFGDGMKEYSMNIWQYRSNGHITGNREDYEEHLRYMVLRRIIHRVTVLACFTSIQQADLYYRKQIKIPTDQKKSAGIFYYVTNVLLYHYSSTWGSFAILTAISSSVGT